MSFRLAFGRAVTTRMENWRFFQDALSLWAWEHTAPDGCITLCARRFSSRVDCIADAMRHGYLAVAERTSQPPIIGAPQHLELSFKTRDPPEAC